MGLGFSAHYIPMGVRLYGFSLSFICFLALGFWGRWRGLVGDGIRSGLWDLSGLGWVGCRGYLYLESGVGARIFMILMCGVCAECFCEMGVVGFCDRGVGWVSV